VKGVEVFERAVNRRGAERLFDDINDALEVGGTA